MSRIGNHSSEIAVSLPKDEKGMTARECPRRDCLDCFKVKTGTGLKGANLPCHCPYCGHSAGHDHFYTKSQRAYLKSVAMNHAAVEVHRMLKGMEFDHRPQGGLGISVSMRVTGGPQTFLVPRYWEPKLETDVVCDHCTLHYAIYGVFAFCPDCGEHNSLQILGKNLDVVEKVLALAESQPPEVMEQLIENALEDVVSAFDGFGREACRVAALSPAGKTQSETHAVKFQNLAGARQNLQKFFGFDLASAVTSEEWETACRGFQKRHVVSHKMSVADAEYVAKSKDTTATVGRKVSTTAAEVKLLASMVRKLAAHVACSLRAAVPQGPTGN